MFNKKKTECRVCGYRFTPERENIYTAEEPRSALEMLTAAPTRFSAVDCPICGCQIALAIRVPRVDISDNAERHDADALNIPASPYPDGDKGVLACPNCGSGEYLHNADENENAFCGQCGQAIKWGSIACGRLQVSCCPLKKTRAYKAGKTTGRVPCPWWRSARILCRLRWPHWCGRRAIGGK